MGEAARIEQSDRQDGRSHNPTMTSVPGTGAGRPPAERPEPRVVEVRRNAALAGAVGVVAAGVSIAYLGRATSTGAPLDWVLTLVTAGFAVAWLWSLLDARTPLLVADPHGVRVRLGRTWEGLPWHGLDRLEHHPRQGLRRDGRLVVVPEVTAPLLESLDAGGRRQARISTRLHGSPLAVPLGLSTRLTGVRPDELSEVLRGLAGGDAEVVETGHSGQSEQSGQSGQSEQSGQSGQSEQSAPRRLPDPRPAVAALIASLGERLRRRPERAPEAEAEAEVEAEAELEGPEAPEHETEVEEPAAWHDEEPVVVTDTPEPSRERRSAQRAEVRRDAPDRQAVVVPASSVLPEASVLRRDAEGARLVEDTEVWGTRVRPIARGGDAVDPIVLDDYSTEPAADPVVGPELAAARTRLALSVDQLAERTRIRPHVIESIEVDDFAPCGGDFYARGHLRTLARVLGVDSAGLLASYDARYADAPIDARRVFAAELATGSSGSIRSTRGGPSWTLLVAAVMVVVLAWSIARLVMDDPVELQPAPGLNGSGGPAQSAPVAPEVPLEVRAVQGGASVEVRDGAGEVVWSGDLAMGETTDLDVSPPVRIETSDGGAIATTLDGRDTGRLGQPGQPASDTLVPR